MELWIRSQDREDLVKVNALWIMGNQIWMEVPFYENHKKIGLSITGHNHKLAEYSTKERALEVLDEIQKIIRWCQTDMRNVTIGDTNNLIGSFEDYVYEMPEE